MVPSISFTFRHTPLGCLLVAASERGVCHVRFGESEAELSAALARELPAARLERDDARLAAWADALACAAGGEGTAQRAPRTGSTTSSVPRNEAEPSGDVDGVPLDVAGSRFQRRVWDALRAIPRGRTLAYSDVAAALGEPRAVRAVANACAANPVALAIPCHRVVPRDGGTGGYRYGAWRKAALLAHEAREPARRSDARATVARGASLARE